MVRTFFVMIISSLVLNPVGITALPNQGDQAKMYVDFVRVYQK